MCNRCLQPNLRTRACVNQADWPDWFASHTYTYTFCFIFKNLCFSAGRQEVVVDSSVKATSSTVFQGAKVSSGVNVLSELHALQLKLESMESALGRHQHIPVGQGAPAQCTSLITGTQVKATLVVPDLLTWYKAQIHDMCTHSQHGRFILKAAQEQTKICSRTSVPILSSWCM